MLEKGEIVKIDGKFAIVQFQRKGYCDTCQRCKVTKDGAHSQMKVENTLGLNEGDFVEIDFSEKKLTLAYVFTYAIPIVLIAICAFIGTLFNMLAVAIMCSVALVVGLAISLLIDFFAIRKRKRLEPKMVRIARKEE